MSNSLLDGKTFSFNDISVSSQNQILSFGNELFVRQLDLSEAVPRTKSFVYLPLNKELSFEQELFDFSFIGYGIPGGPTKIEFELVDISACVIPASWSDGEHVKVDIHIKENVQRLEFIKSYFIYPGQPFLGTQNSVKSPVSANIYWSRRLAIEQAQDFPLENQESRVEVLRLSSDFKTQRSVQFRGRTDYTNDLVIENNDLKECVNGNLLFCESDDCGIFFLQEAPPSRERRDLEDHDFRITDNNTVCSCCWGIAPAEVKADSFLSSYRTVIGIYPLAEEQQSLKKYLRLRFPEAEEDYTVTVNPWGCGNFPELVNEQFLLDEIAASGEINATHYQVDDGWQKGRALRELTTYNRNIQPDFWDISKPHLPNGFDSLLKQSHDSDVKIALWVAPSFNCEYRDWQVFADMLFDFYEKYNIKMFKIDAVKIRTKEAEDNLRKLFTNLRERSNGEIFFNLDTTNGQRPGYFMFLEYGNIFLENRYVHRETFCPYHPEFTLRNLWRLSKYMRPQVLQIEVPNPHAVNHEGYTNQKITHPDVYPVEYWLAIAMFANPLIWLAPSQLPDDTKKVFRKMVDLHLKYRTQIFEEEIYPIGAEPNGKALTGFVSTNTDGTKGFILAFRELEGPEKAVWDIPIIKSKSLKITHIASNAEGEITSLEAAKVKVELAEKASYLMVEFTA
jgi:alpha-galactosidase